MYSVIWKYRVNPDYRKIFEKEYGSQGAWYKLFSRSIQYMGSLLRKNPDDDSYLLTDIWESKEAYDEFLKTNAADYTELSNRLDYLHTFEEYQGAAFTPDP